MFSYKCPRCSLRSFSVEGSRCFRCDSNATTNCGLGDNFERRQQETATSSDTESTSGSRNLFQNKIKTSKVIGLNGKRNESKDRTIAEDIQAHKQCRKEICTSGDQVLSPLCKPGSSKEICTVGNQVFSPLGKPDIRKCDFIPKMYAGTIHNNTHHEFLNVEKPQSCNQVNEALCSSDKMLLLTVNKNTESNIRTLQCSQIQNTLSKVKNLEASNVKNLLSLKNTFAVQGPSDIRVNENGQNLIGEIMHSGGLSKVQSIQPANEKKFLCNVCDVEIHEHGKIEGRSYRYFCCVCKYTTHSECYLQLHSDIHCPQKVCNVCSKEYRDGNMHDSEHICKACGKKCDCKTLLDHHSVRHEQYFSEHCRFCGQKISIHFTKKNGKRTYLCCSCNFRSPNIHNFKHHSNIHCPKLFCLICREEYPIKEKDFHGIKSRCIVCGIEFKCKTMLEDHLSMLKDHKKSFFSVCGICEEPLHKHTVSDDKFKCCFCARKFIGKHKLQEHLFSHTNIKLFKCDWCKKRYCKKTDLENHSETCVPLPYKCKICSARFPCIVSRDKHRLEKHGPTEDAVV